MLTELKIQNFKLFKNFHLKDLPQILLIGGKNNSGKTSILEAIQMIFQCGNPSMFIDHLVQRGLRSIHNQPDIVFEPAYHNFNLDQPIVFEYTLNSSQKKLEYHFSPRIEGVQSIPAYNQSIEVPKTPIGRGIRIIYGDETALLIQRERDLSLGEPQGNKIHLPSYNEEMRYVFLTSTSIVSSEVNANRYSQLNKDKNTDGILERLQIIEPKIKSLSVVAFTKLEPLIYADIGIAKQIPLCLMGQGMDRLLSILLAISEARDGVVLIDELGIGFHYSVLSKAWDAIVTHAKANKTQLIATTHSREMVAKFVEGLPLDMRDDFQYMRVERQDKDIKSINYNFESIQTALESHFEFR